MLLNSWKNNSSTTSLVQHHAQPVERHACSMLMEELWASGFWLNCLNVYTTIHWLSSVQMPKICGFIGFHFAQHHEEQSEMPKRTLLPTMLYTHHCTGIISIKREAQTQDVGGTEGLWKDVLSFQSHKEVTPEVHSLWGCTAPTGLVPNGENGVKRKKKKSYWSNWGNLYHPQLQLGDVDHPALHKVHKHTGFNVSVNTLPFPSAPTHPTPPLHIFSSLRNTQKCRWRIKRRLRDPELIQWHSSAVQIVNIL